MQFKKVLCASLFVFLSTLNCFGQTPYSKNSEALQKFEWPALGFEENRGQFDNGIYFVSELPGYNVYLDHSSLVLAFPGTAAAKSPELVRISFTGADQKTQPLGKDLMPGVSHYYIGSNPAKWKTDIRRFDRVHYSGIYPGVDLIFYSNRRQLEFDYNVAAGAESSSLGLAFDGATVKLQDGNLELRTPSGRVAVLKKPELYQLQDGKRHKVSGGYFFRNSTQVAFKVGKYNRQQPLVIDPALIYSTLVGGSMDLTPFAITVDSTGGAYVTGSSVTPGPKPSAFVLKLDPTGSTLVYLAHLGGSHEVFSSSPETAAAGFEIALDGGDNAYITGITDETDFPVTNSAFSTAHLCASGSSGLSCEEAFASKLDATGKLVYSTFLVKASTLDTAGPMPSSIAVDSNGALYVTGTTFQEPVCSGCPPHTAAGLTTTPGAFQTKRKNDNSGFVLKLHPDGSALDYSTYLGGSTGETRGGIAVDSSGVAYVDGGTSSADFPVTMGAFQTTNSGTNAFFSKIKADGSGLLYSTFLTGPNGPTEATSIAIDSGNAAYLVGITDSHLPTPPTGPGSLPAFAAKFDSSGSLVYSNLLLQTIIFNPPGSDVFIGSPPQSAVAVDSTGAAYIAETTDFVLSASIFVTKLNANGSAVYTAPVGPIAPNSGRFGGMAMDSNQNLYVAGVAGFLRDTADTAPDAVFIPDIVTTVGSFQPLPLASGPNGSTNIGFVQKFAQSLGHPVPAPNPRLVIFTPTLQKGVTSISRTVMLFNKGDTDLSINSISAGGANPGDFAISNNQCGATVTAGQNCTLLTTFTPTVTQGTRTATVDFSFGGGVASQSIILTGQAGVPAFQANPNKVDFGVQALGQTTLPPFRLTITNTGTAPMNLLATPSIVGANAGDFGVCDCNGGTFTWPASVDAGASIVAPIVFKPTAMGPRSAQLVLQTDAPGSPQMISFSGTGSALSIAAQSSSSTVTAGQMATYNLIVNTGSTTSGTITVSCTGAPSGASCTPNPGSYSAAVSSLQDVTITVSTTARSSAFKVTPPAGPWWFAMATLGLMLFRTRQFRRALKLAGAFALLATMLSCGGGGSNGGGGGGGGGGTPAGTFTLTVTATSSSGSGSIPLTLTVQ